MLPARDVTSVSSAAHISRALGLLAACLPSVLDAPIAAAAPAAIADEPGAALVAVCAACHRLDGHDQGQASIIGLPVNELASAMWVLRSDERSNPVMRAVSLTFTDAEIAIIARRLQTLRPPSAP